MDWYVIVIMILGVLVFFSTILLFLAREQVKLRFKAFLLRKSNSVFYTELGEDLKKKEGIAKLDDGKIVFSNKTYPIDNKHIYYMPSYGITGVVVSEKTGTSIDPNGTSSVSPTVINGIIKRIKATAMGEAMKIIKIMYMILIAFGVIVVIQIFALVRFYMSMEAAGIKVTF